MEKRTTYKAKDSLLHLLAIRKLNASRFREPAQMSTAEQPKNEFDIIAVIGEHVTLKKFGQGYVGLCPFHLEKTPSFYVSRSRRRYKYFGCDASGDVFTFVQQKENLGVAANSYATVIDADATENGITVKTADGRFLRYDRAHTSLP
jgi:DNA primase